MQGGRRALFGIQVTQSLVELYDFYRCQDSELVGIIERLESLAETLQRLERHCQIAPSKRTNEARLKASRNHSQIARN